MIVIIEGEDYIRKAATIRALRAKWTEPEVVWANEWDPKDLADYLETQNEVVVRSIDKLIKYIENRARRWRERSMIFELEKLPSGHFSRVVRRVGRVITCTNMPPGTVPGVVELAKLMGCAQVAWKISKRATTMSEAYWQFMRYSLAGEMPHSKWAGKGTAVVKWEPTLLNIRIDELLAIFTQIASTVVLMLDGKSKWEIVQKLIASGQDVNAVYGASRMITTFPELGRAFVRRMKKLSHLLEEAGGIEPPIEYVFLRLKEVRG